MLSFLFSDVSTGQLFVRMAATALVVIGVALAVGRLGPMIGGALAGLPIVLGPGFYFLVIQTPPEFVSDAAVYSLLSLCATQIFLLMYILSADRVGALPSLLAALAAWAVSAALFRLLTPQLLLVMLLFAVVTVTGRRLAAGFIEEASVPARATDFHMLLLRALLAGLLVTIVTALASQLGASASGLLLAFPVGYTVLSVTIHEQFGSAAVKAALYSAILGTISLGGFCATLAFALSFLPPLWAFLAGLVASVLITIGVISQLRSDRRAVRIH